MDRSVLESDPHRVLEGMAIAAYAVGASRATSTCAPSIRWPSSACKTAIRQAERFGLLGTNICGTRFSFRIDVRLGAGAFVCGEETALIASVEGKRGTPRPRPPYPGDGRPVGQPDADQQRRDLRQHRADHPQRRRVVRRASARRRARARRCSRWPARVSNTGLVEVPMGITCARSSSRSAAAFPDGRKFKAVQTGGPSGGCIPAEHLDMPVDYESLAQRRLDHGLGRHDRHGRDLLHGGRRPVLHGVLHDRVLRQVRSVPRRHLADAPPARHDPQLSATPQDLELLEELCDLLKNTSLCGLGQSAPNPVLSTLRYFAEEYRAHIEEHQCPGRSLRQATCRRRMSPAPARSRR